MLGTEGLRGDVEIVEVCILELLLVVSVFFSLTLVFLSKKVLSVALGPFYDHRV
jgi:hypothetical protein